VTSHRYCTNLKESKSSLILASGYIPWYIGYILSLQGWIQITKIDFVFDGGRIIKTEEAHASVDGITNWRTVLYVGERRNAHFRACHERIIFHASP